MGFGLGTAGTSGGHGGHVVVQWLQVDKKMGGVLQCAGFVWVNYHSLTRPNSPQREGLCGEWPPNHRKFQVGEILEFTHIFVFVSLRFWSLECSKVDGASSSWVLRSGLHPASRKQHLLRPCCLFFMEASRAEPKPDLGFPKTRHTQVQLGLVGCSMSGLVSGWSRAEGQVASRHPKPSLGYGAVFFLSLSQNQTPPYNGAGLWFWEMGKKL